MLFWDAIFSSFFQLIIRFSLYLLYRKIIALCLCGLASNKNGFRSWVLDLGFSTSLQSSHTGWQVGILSCSSISKQRNVSSLVYSAWGLAMSCHFSQLLSIGCISCTIISDTLPLQSVFSEPLTLFGESQKSLEANTWDLKQLQEYFIVQINFPIFVLNQTPRLWKKGLMNIVF